MEEFSEINKKIKANAKQGEVNTIFPFIEKRLDKKLSIVGVYDNNEKTVVNGIGENVPFIASDYYYGLSPSFASDEICSALKAGVFKNSNSLEKFINDNANLFTVPASMRKYARALFAKVLVKMSTMFGYIYECENKECYKRFCEIAVPVAEKDLDYDLQDKELIIRLLGEPNDSFLTELSNNFSINEKGKLTLKSYESEETLLDKMSANKMSLVQGKGYYSGVLPRVRRFEWCNLDYSNAKVKSLAIIFERTTYATMDAFDSSYIKKHRLLKEYVTLLEEMDEYEDTLLNEYFSNLYFSNEIILEKVNKFLTLSYSAHNLAVSGNIVTVDGYLIFAQREAKNIDANLYYCSINGQSEINDNKVGFYKKSVYEDIPTLCIESKGRIDFMGELERETEAELNILCPASHWQLLGVSFLSIISSEGNETEHRRFHFNILASCLSEYRLSHIVKTQKIATEKFENRKLIGVKIKRHKNFFTRVGSFVKDSFLWLLKSKDFITSFFALAIFAMGFNELFNSEFTVKSLSSVISIIFTALSLLVLIINLIKAFKDFLKRKATHHKLTIIGECKDFYSKIHCGFKSKNINLHPIADLMFYEYLKFNN